MNNWQHLLIIAIGGGIGSVSRYLTSQWLAQRLGPFFPYGTLAVNVIGCFIIGLFMTFATERFIINPLWRLLITVGFLGGLTTFSSFSYETIKMLEEAEYLLVLANVSLNCLIGFSATWAGMLVARSL
ncbi:fluoride efflux transporter CrcB [Azotosporobacter soli]|uniref:fluoride efflux transporter CrcB n=1 Tax=Azotosporobacter soli TaxID=3055040 RepID=UPI0031FF202C